MDLAVVRSAVVYSLFVVSPIVCGGLALGLCSVYQYFMFFLVLQSSRRGREIRAWMYGCNSIFL